MSTIVRAGPIILVDPAARDIDDYAIAALAGGGFALTALEVRSSSTRYDPSIHDLVYSATLQQVGTTITRTVDHFDSRITALDPDITALTDGGFVTAMRREIPGGWGTEIWSYAMDAVGVQQDAWRPKPLFGLANRDVVQSTPALVTLANGTVATVFKEDTGVYAAVVRPDGTPVAAPVDVNITGLTSVVVIEAVALQGGGFAALLRARDSVAGRNVVELRRFDNDGDEVGSPTTLAGLPNPGIIDEAAMVGLPDGGVYIALPYDFNASSRLAGIHGIRVAADGTQIGTVVRMDDVNLWNRSQAGMSATLLDDGGFALAWSSAVANPDDSFSPFVDLAVRLFDADGTPRGAAQLFPTGQDRFGDNIPEGRPQIVQMANSELLLSWLAEGAQDRTDNVYAMRLVLPEPGRLLQGGPGPDTLTGGRGDDTIAGAGGDDLLSGGQGNDRILGDPGADTLRGGDGADTLNGGTGDDLIFGGASSADLRDVIFGGDGNDRIDAGHGNDEVFGGAGHDTVEGGFGVDTLYGQDGNDVLTGSAFSDLIFGGAGDDFVNGGFGSDRVNGGIGADRFYHLGIADHGSDWIQDYRASDGDRLVFGGAASRNQFQLNFAETANAGSAGVAEAFVIWRPTGQILWALVDGFAQDNVMLQAGGQVYDLMLG
jgi:hypothetical protein